MNADAATQGSLNQLITKPPPPVTAIAKKKVLAVAKPIHKLFLEFCHHHGFAGFSFPRIDTVYNPKKKIVDKKPVGLPNRAQGQISPFQPNDFRAAFSKIRKQQYPSPAILS